METSWKPYVKKRKKTVMDLLSLKSAIENQTPYKLIIIDPLRGSIEGKKFYFNGRVFRYIDDISIVHTPQGLVSVLRGKKILRVTEEKAEHLIGRLQNLINGK